MESSMLKSVIIQEKKGDLWIKVDFIPMQYKDSKLLAQSRYAQKKEDVDALTVLIEEKSAWSYYEEAQVIVEIVYFICALEYRYAVLSRGMQHQ